MENQESNPFEWSMNVYSKTFGELTQHRHEWSHSTFQTTELGILKKSIHSSTHQDSNAGHQMQIYIALMV